MLSRISALRALLPLVLSAAFGLSAPAWAQETAARSDSGASVSVAGVVSTRDALKFIPPPPPSSQDVALRNRRFQGRLPQQALIPGVNRKADVQLGKPPKETPKTDLAFSDILTGFHAYDGPNPYIPPDPTMAAGGNDLVVATNDGWGIYDKSGNQTYSVDFNTWFGDSADEFSDPHVVYDPWTGYYYMTVLEINFNNNTAAWYVDVSPQYTASGSHHYYIFNARLNGSTDANTWMDYPYIGYSASAVYLTGSMIDFSTNNFVYDKIRILKPSEIDGGGSAGYYDYWNLQSNGSVDFDISPAQQLTSEGVEYLVNAQGGGGNYDTIRRITNETDFNPTNNGGPHLSTEVIGVSQYNAPQPAVQPDGTPSLEAGDCRVGAATMQYGRLNVIGSTNVDFGSGPRDAAKINRFLVDSGAPSTVDRDTTFGYSSLDIYYPAITGTVDNDQLLTFDYSGTGSGQYPSIAIAGWGNTEGSVDQALQSKAGEGDYFQDFGSGRNRWGDFSAICLDPNNYRDVWSTSEYAGTGSTASNGLWSTWVNQFNILPGGVVAVNSAVGSIGQTIALSANLTNEQTGAVISGEDLDFYVDGTYVGSATTDGSGNGSVNYTIPSIGPGYHTITVNFPGDSSYNPGSGSNTLTVYANTSLAVPTVSGAAGHTVTLSATLTQNDTGADLSGQTVYFYVDGSYIGSAVTNSSGVASLSYAIPANEAGGSHTLEAYFPGAGFYNSADTFGTLTVTVSKLNTVTTVGNRIAAHGTTAALKSYLKTSGGAVLAGRTLTYKVNGVAAGSAVTDSTGLATLNYAIPASAPAGNEPIAVSFAGDSTDNPSSGTGTLTVTAPVLTTSVTVAAVSGNQGQTVNLSATLKAGTTLLSGKTLTFKVDSTTVGTAVTNASGVATKAFAIPSAETAGNHTITVSFAGDSGDAASSGTGTLTVTVAKTNTVVTVGARTAKAGTTTPLKSYLKTSGGAVLAGRTLTYKVNGVAAGSAVTDSTGLATLNYPVPTSAPAGNEPIAVSFAGDGTDNPSSGFGTLTVTH